MFRISLLACLLAISSLAVSAQPQCRLLSRGAVAASGGNPNGQHPFVPDTTNAGPGTPSSNVPSSAPSAAPKPFNYSTSVIRGVNLGGWFVLEPWITPSIFQNTGNTAIVDEFTFGQMQDYNTALGVLNSHWSTWITEDDFVAIAAAGLSHVRIPLGYWSVPLTSNDTQYGTSITPYIPGAWTYFLQALNWARKHSVYVIVDLHGAPGSQNGFDNSGQRTNNPTWASNQTNVNRTLDAIQFIVDNVGGLVDVVELLNEPTGFESSQDASTISAFWSDGYDTVRNSVGNNTMVMIGDAFLGVDNWQHFLTYPSAVNVIMDKHEYQLFSVLELQRSFDQHIAFACSFQPDLVSFAENNIWTIIGEWSTAITDCAQWLNGRGVGARWEGSWYEYNQPLGSCQGWSGDMSGFSAEYKAFLRKYWEVQVEIGESIQGWVYWTWKNENADDWSYMKGLQGGWIPQDPTNRMYPGICN